MPDINDLIVALYDDAVPLQNIIGLPANFKVPRRNLEVSLFHGQPQTPEESDSMEADAHIAVEMIGDTTTDTLLATICPLSS